MDASGLKSWLHRRRWPQRYRYLTELLAHQALSADELLRYQQARLEAILAFARNQTAYYAEAFAAQEGRQLSELPILTKAIVRARLADLLAKGHDPARTPIGYTSGSTGEPLAFYYDEEKHERMRAGMMRSFMLSGWRPGQKILYLWGARIDTQRGGVFAARRWEDWIAAEKTLCAHEIDDGKLLQWQHMIARERPVLLYGYASAIAVLARWFLDRHIAPPESLLGVYTTAETLSPHMRALIEEAFRVKVFNQYGCREVPNIACECRHGRMHVFTDLVVLESLAGRLLVTSLTNRLMPMIRYELGDYGELLAERCECTLPFPLMKMDIARANDFVLTTDGRMIHPSFLNRLLDGLLTIKSYQFVQERKGALTLRLVLKGELPAALVESWRRQLSEQGLALAIEYVAEIPRTASGKHRYVLCALQ
ncbi:MAG: hypothetical protein N2441_05975 [Rhodocyclaceae bacterium]|nr:hypothetical protein [Rhodocyclaceae bacterium]